MEEKKYEEVPFYIHEAVCDKLQRSSKEALDKMDSSNKRLLTALITVCVTLIITVCCFLYAYKDMNNTWMDFFQNRTEEGVQDGGNLFVQGDPSADQATLDG